MRQAEGAVRLPAVDTVQPVRRQHADIRVQREHQEREPLVHVQRAVSCQLTARHAAQRERHRGERSVVHLPSL